MRKKSNAQKILEGNPGRRPLTTDPESIKGIPDQPAILQGESLAEWHRMTALLDKAGILTTIDGAALTMYCLAWAKFSQAERELQANGPVFEANGFLRLSPWAKQCKALLIEFGFTPASRAKANIQQPAAVIAPKLSKFAASRDSA